MRGLGFTLQPTEAEQAAAAAAAVAAASAASAAAADASPTGDAGGGSSAVKTGADAVLRDLRDTYIATMKAPILPPWFLGPVEAAAVAPRTPRSPKSKGGSGSAPSASTSASAGAGASEAPAPSGRGVTLRTTRAVAPGELLAVSLPLAVCYCDRGTTPENEELADLMLGTPGAAAAAGRITAVVADAEDNVFEGLTDLQQSLLGMLWRGHGAAASSDDGSSAGSTGEAAAAPEAQGAQGKASSTGGGGGSGPVKRAFLEMVAKSAADGGAARSLPLVSGPEELYRLVNLNCMGEDFQVGLFSSFRY